jgi:hypothetical protein
MPDFFTIAARANRVDTHLEGTQFGSNLTAQSRIVTGDGRNQSAVRDVHF